MIEINKQASIAKVSVLFAVNSVVSVWHGKFNVWTCIKIWEKNL